MPAAAPPAQAATQAAAGMRPARRRNIRTARGTLGV
jgi:hypothetical protein